MNIERSNTKVHLYCGNNTVTVKSLQTTTVEEYIRS